MQILNLFATGFISSEATLTPNQRKTYDLNISISRSSTHSSTTTLSHTQITAAIICIYVPDGLSICNKNIEKGLNMPCPNSTTHPATRRRPAHCPSPLSLERPWDTIPPNPSMYPMLSACSHPYDFSFSVSGSPKFWIMLLMLMLAGFNPPHFF